MKRINPVIEVEGSWYLLMTRELASVRTTLLGEQVMDARHHRQTIKAAMDFIFDGF